MNTGLLLQTVSSTNIIQTIFYSADKFRRGLIIDKRRGNIIKIDRHKYVRKVYHGLEEVTAAIRKSIYSQQVASFTESHYANIDTMFLLVDAVLFTYLVDFHDRHPDLIPKSYEQIYSDIRNAVDLCHRDGTIKDTVVQDPGKYIIFDEGTVPMLKQLRQAGKKVFLLTNSLFDYTAIVMDYLVHGQGGNHEIKWEELFDLIVVGGNKPAFLQEDYLSIFRVDSAGQLHNIEDKDSIHRDILQQHKIFHGGCWQDLHRMLGISSGDRILYVGDHMYSDILRSKRSLGWRTCLIIPELEQELAVARKELGSAQEILKLRKLQSDLDEYIDFLRLKIRVGMVGVQDDVDHQLQEAEMKSIELKNKLRDMTEAYSSKFNAFWGQLFKAGHQDSRFGNQVVNYACLYTSRVSNLGLVSPNRPFRPVQDFMPHDQVQYEYTLSLNCRKIDVI